MFQPHPASSFSCCKFVNTVVSWCISHGPVSNDCCSSNSVLREGVATKLSFPHWERRALRRLALCQWLPTFLRHKRSVSQTSSHSSAANTSHILHPDNKVSEVKTGEIWFPAGSALGEREQKSNCISLLTANITCLQMRPAQLRLGCPHFGSQRLWNLMNVTKKHLASFLSMLILSFRKIRPYCHLPDWKHLSVTCKQRQKRVSLKYLCPWRQRGMWIHHASKSGFNRNPF